MQRNHSSADCAHSLQSRGKWSEGPEDGGIARTHAARLLAELAGQPGLHDYLIKLHAASVLADSAAYLVRPMLSMLLSRLSTHTTETMLLEAW